MLLDVTHVTVQPGFTLALEFENGERRQFNMAAFVENGTVAWPGNIDIDPETLYEYSVAVA
jgi:hypothetical protein